MIERPSYIEWLDEFRDKKLVKVLTGLRRSGKSTILELYQARLRLLPVVTPDEFLACLRDAMFVVVSSFHGCVFSVLFGKRFLNLYGDDSKSRDSRQAHLLGELGLFDHRLPWTASDDRMLRVWDLEYDVTDRLSEMRRSSMDYLREAIRLK